MCVPIIGFDIFGIGEEIQRIEDRIGNLTGNCARVLGSVKARDGIQTGLAVNNILKEGFVADSASIYDTQTSDNHSWFVAHEKLCRRRCLGIILVADRGECGSLPDDDKEGYCRFELHCESGSGIAYYFNDQLMLQSNNKLRVVISSSLVPVGQ